MSDIGATLRKLCLLKPLLEAGEVVRAIPMKDDRRRGILTYESAAGGGKEES